MMRNIKMYSCLAKLISSSWRGRICQMDGMDYVSVEKTAPLCGFTVLRRKINGLKLVWW